MAGVAGSSVGLPEIPFVLQAEAGHAGIIQHVTGGDYTNKTYCVRLYIHEDPSEPYLSQFPGVFGPDDLKGTSQETKGGVWALGGGANWSTDGTLRFNGPTMGSGWSNWDIAESFKWETSGTRVGAEACSSGWCRVEHCYDHDWDGTDRYRVRARVVDISTGDAFHYGPHISANSNPTNSGPTNRNWAWRFKCDRGCGDGGSCDGGCNGKLRWASHAMWAAWPSDAGADCWIGRAEEVTSDVGPSTGGGCP